MPRLLVLLLVLLAAALSACGGDDDDDAARPATTATAEEPAEQTAEGCRKVQAPGPKGEGDLRSPTTRLDRRSDWRAVVTTNCGAFTIELDVKRAPKTTSSFAYLARRGFYDGLTIHRIVPSFVFQGGDPTGTGEGAPGYKIVERPPKDLKYTRGVVAMAKTELEDPGTSGSQFFVVTAEDAELPPDYALVGKVGKGLDDTVQRIGIQRSNPRENDRPIQPIVIESIKIEKG